MSTDVNYSIKGTSDVPQQVDKAKKAMSEMDRQTAAIGKKFTELGKDLFMGFLAPMVLIREAISFITGSIEKARQDARDAVDFAAGIKLEELDKSPVEATTRYLSQKLQVDIRTEEEIEKAEKAKEKVVEEFLRRDKRGKAITQEFAPTLRDPETGMLPYDVEYDLAKLSHVQQKVFALVNEEMKKAMEKERGAAESDKQKAAKELGVFAGDNSVFGVGNSPQMNLLNQQIELQKMANEYLAVIAAASGTPTDFTKDQSNGNASKNVYYQTTNVS